MIRRRARCWATLGLLAVLTVPADLYAASCPSAVHFVPDATGPLLDAGWQGYAHDVPFLGTTLDLGVICAATTPPCGTCSITGPLLDPVGSPWRCDNDTSIACTVASEVALCGAPSTCRYYLSPPQSLAIVGLAFCATLAADGPLSGTVGVESGALTVTAALRTMVSPGVHFGASANNPTQGCPRCDGDATVNDGLRAGTCDAGPRQGLACDANAVAPFADFGSTSFDCPPSTANENQLVTHPFTFSTSPQSVSLTADSPLCTATGFTSSPCLCDTCNTAAAEPCATNADCPVSGGNPGICGGRRCMGGSNTGAPCTQSSACPGGGCNRPPSQTRPNGCAQDTVTPGDDCAPDGDGGMCTAGPTVTSCIDNPNRACLTDNDCGGALGACEARNVSCFRDNGVLGGTVTAGGTATPTVDGVAIPTALGALACTATVPNPFVHTFWGLPGLTRLQQPGTLLFDDTDLPPCPASPENCRAPFVAGKASLELKDRTPDDKDQLAWKWVRGAETTLPELGDPLASTEYALCLYDASGLRASMAVHAGGTCGTRPCWQTRPNGFRYRNTSGTPNGIVDLVLRAGTDGKAQIQAKGRGLDLPMPAIAGLTTTLQMQLRNRTNGRCWGATYSPPFDKVTAEQLRDKAD